MEFAKTLGTMRPLDRFEATAVSQAVWSFMLQGEVREGLANRKSAGIS